MTIDQQSFLLSDSAMQSISYSTYENFKPQLTLTATELQQWKQRVIAFQVKLSAAPSAQQGSLFDLSREDETDPASIDPFSRRRQNTEFWRWQFDDVGAAAMYFVIDYAAIAGGGKLLLYVGETVKSNQRWKGEHDCKRYLANYRQAHYDHGLDSELGIAFWPQAPVERQARQKLEAALIYRWRSPFNKENWRFWNTPFVSGKPAGN
ncbi:MAG: GIY-YIG nuclease family protein [Phormidesmis sp.]